MPADVTIFAAKYLVFIEALLALVICFWLLYRRTGAGALRWLVACVVTGVLAYLFAKIGAALYNDPRPFMTDHVKPLVSHAAGNGFPSEHALLAAFFVAAVFFLSPAWSVPVAVLAILVDWGRVGAGVHHVVDVVGSSIFVIIAALVAFLIAPTIARMLLPLLPDAWTVGRSGVRQV